MTKEQAPAAVLAQPSPADEPLTITQWATARSAIEKSPELLNAFASIEERAGRFTGTKAEWDARYAAFSSRPCA